MRSASRPAQAQGFHSWAWAKASRYSEARACLYLPTIVPAPPSGVFSPTSGLFLQDLFSVSHKPENKKPRICANVCFCKIHKRFLNVTYCITEQTAKLRFWTILCEVARVSDVYPGEICSRWFLSSAETHRFDLRLKESVLGDLIVSIPPRRESNLLGQAQAR